MSPMQRHTAALSRQPHKVCGLCTGGRPLLLRMAGIKAHIQKSAFTISIKRRKHNGTEGKTMKSEPKIIDLLKEKDEEIERLNQLLESWTSDNDRLKSELRLLSEENKELKKQIEKLKSEKAKLIKTIKQRVWNKAIKPFRTEGVLELLKGDEK